LFDADLIRLEPIIVIIVIIVVDRWVAFQRVIERALDRL
jgi:hypothetical protein